MYYNEKFVSEIKYDTLGQPYVTVTITDKNGFQIKKDMEIDNYINFLSENTRIIREVQRLRIGKFPYGYYDGSIATDGSMSVIIVLPKAKRYFNDGKAREIVFPSLCFYLKTNRDGRLIDSLCYALKDNAPPNKDTKLYLYPYGNVSHTGFICWGNGQQYTKELVTLKDFETVLEVFFSSKTAPHFYQADVNTSLGVTHHELVEIMSEKDEFPEDILRAADATLGEIINKL